MSDRDFGWAGSFISSLFVQDDVQLPKMNGQQLDLTSLLYEDSGVYVCVGTNLYGQVNASFIVDVVGKEMAVFDTDVVSS